MGGIAPEAPPLADEAAAPNVVLVMADQLGAHAVPAYGNVPVDAPTLSRLGREGVVFENAYCNSPLCAPSRASMMTARLPSRVGVYDNAAELSSSVPTIAHHLRARGYDTCLVGKMHFIGPDQLHGFEERLTTDFYPAGLDWTPDWDRPPAERLPWYHDMRSVLRPGTAEVTLQTDFDDEVVFRSVRRINDLARNAARRPFFLVVSFTHPHDPWEIPERYWRRYDGRRIDLPAVPRIPLEDLDPHSRRIRHMCGDDADEIADETVRTARLAYYAAVSYVDERIGQVLAALDATALRRDTVVVVTADHGEMLGERGLWYKMSFFEPSARVPLILHAPTRFAARRLSRPVSLVDLLPTLVEIATGATFASEDALDGTSLVPLLRGQEGGPSEVVGEYLAEGAIAPVVMIRRGLHKFVHSPVDPDQLYDLSSDRDEVQNIAGDDDAAAVVKSFRDEITFRWDLRRLHADVLASQRRRRLVFEALSRGRPTSWDHRPADDSPDRYVRGHDFWAAFTGTTLRTRGDDPDASATAGDADGG
jgi:choline-sulfatase